MSAGVGLFGTFSGFLSSWFVGESGESSDAELIAVKEELARLPQSIERRG